MPTYVVRARDAKGNPVRRKVTAETPTDVRTTLRSQGLFVQEINQDRSLMETINNFDMKEVSTAFASVSVKDKAIFSRQFASLVNAGVAMVRGLGVLADQCPNPKLKKALQEISSDVQQGTDLSDAMRKHPQCFDGLYVSMIQAGEVGGVLDEVLNRLSKLLEDIARLQNQIKSAMAYPITVGVIAVSVFIGMCVFLLPTFANVFEELGAELPMFTQIMLNISAILRTPIYSITLIAVVALLVFAYRQYYKTRVGRETMDRFFLKMPLFGDLIQKTATARFCRTFGALSRSGVPILTSLEIVRDTSGNQVVANAIDSARREVQTGGMITMALQREQVFPIMAIQMISIGEETGELDSMLFKVADFYEDEVEQSVKALTSVMEPIMIVFLGGMVGSILVAMYLPMFKVMDAIG
ncbi:MULTISPECIES: type II secretion system F family protein [unclassified Leptolyngbya]|uniref:type II secretion system F family protein n=1 Tax=unclassified Leptolyngbya TaxID=2650499 RepID=UPI001683EDC7|nr:MULTISPECIES: type II secretion system F family protein [unclassified Leptolyngbya]MBD1913013.1 type II secretion system F family protein [Leptolyngbya sp. FACHB-8]MBD2153429.1 type II secretion system F family protein [Leptolyngbya sp. FACHB-16]